MSGGSVFIPLIYLLAFIASVVIPVVKLFVIFNAEDQKSSTQVNGYQGYQIDQIHLFIMNEPDREHLAGITALHQQGCDLNKRYKNEWTALHFAAQRQSLAAVSTLIKFGVEVDANDSEGNSPLYRAVFSAQENGKVIRHLLDHGANPDSENKEGVSPKLLARNHSNHLIQKYF